MKIRIVLNSLELDWAGEAMPTEQERLEILVGLINAKLYTTVVYRLDDPEGLPAPRAPQLDPIAIIKEALRPKV